MSGLLQQEPWLHCYAVRTVDWPVDSQNALYTWGQTFITKYYTETSRGQVSSHRLCVLCGKALLSNTWLLLHCWWSAIVVKCTFEEKWMKEFDFKWFDFKWMNWIKLTYCSFFHTVSWHKYLLHQKQTFCWQKSFLLWSNDNVSFIFFSPVLVLALVPLPSRFHCCTMCESR